MPHAEVEFVDDRGAEYVNPVGRPAVVLIKVVREYPPAVGVAAGPPRRAESEVVRSPPLPLPVDAVLAGGLKVEAYDVAVLGHVNALLVDEVEGCAGERATADGVGQREEVQERLTALVDAGERDDVQARRVGGRRARRVSEARALIRRVAVARGDVRVAYEDLRARAVKRLREVAQAF